jgi:sugar phosphate isomerase/epimerase
MSNFIVGAQMYTLREHLKTPADMAKTLARVKKMGYSAIQVSAFGPVDPKELAKMIKDEGLVTAVTHVSLDVMKDTAKCVDYHQTLGCKYTALGSFGGGGAKTQEVWATFAAEFSAIAKTLAAKGVHVGYHNHAHEFARFSDVTTQSPYALMAEKCDKSVWFELDTYWVAEAGGDPVWWLNKLAGRIPCLHFKDKVENGDGRSGKMCEVGSGNLNWDGIIAASKAGGCEYALVERDSGDMDPFESLEMSLRFLQSKGLK